MEHHLPLGIKIATISDTHDMLNKVDVPTADVVVHAGDFTRIGKQAEIRKFRKQFESLPHQYKIFIAGNHDLSLDQPFYVKPMNWRKYHYSMINGGKFDPYQYSSECIEIVQAPSTNGVVKYLQDELFEIPAPDGTTHPPLKIYGTAWQPEFCNMGFNIPRGSDALLERYKLIPEGVDVLITHTPPYGILDLNFVDENCGCELLLKEVTERIKPRVHIFGHIHESYGKK